MKQIQVNASALILHDASMIFDPTPQIVKLSFEEAMDFSGNFSSFVEMVRTYSRDNMLREHEPYEGFAAVFYNQYHQDVVYVSGAIQRTPSAVGSKRSEYEVVRIKDNKLRTGCFKYVRTFKKCHFAQWADELKDVKKLPVNLDSVLFDKQLKRKLIVSLTKKCPIVLSDEEFMVLSSYFGDYHKKFFTQM